MAKNQFFITTPIYYVNDVPHIGHAYTTIAADVLARYHKSIGDEVFFLTGTDEHGAKIAEAAEKAGQTPEEFVDLLVPRFKEAWSKLGIEYTQFIRTTNPKHEQVVLDLVKKLLANGYIEKRKYEGLYCVSCEKFYTEDELVDGKCPDHKRECVKHSEENYFFLLTKAAKDFGLLGKIKSNEIKVRPESRRNEVLGKIKTGLEDVSISRESVKWGIKFPGDENQTIYVWVDALINYFSATKIYADGPTWPASLHLMAKDILWFHAIIWPALLMAADELPPKQVFAHGFFTIDGQKMSKTIGNVIDPVVLAEKYGADAVRYALLREFPFGEDGDISEAKIALRYESELANGIGNLFNRTLSMIGSYGVKISDNHQDVFGDSVAEKISSLDFMEALNTIRRMVDVANEQIEQGKPWQMVKDGEAEKAGALLNNIYGILLGIAKNIAPFMPETAEKMKNQLKTLKPEPLFPRLED